MGFFDKLFGTPEHKDVPVPPPPPADSSPFNDDAVFFGQRLIDNNNKMLIIFCNKCVNNLVDYNEEWLKRKRSSAEEGYTLHYDIRLTLCASEKTINYKACDKVGNELNYYKQYESYGCSGYESYRTFDFNDIQWSDNHKLYGLIYASLEIICPLLRQKMEGLQDINVNVWPTSSLSVEAVADLSYSVWVNKKYKEM